MEQLQNIKNSPKKLFLFVGIIITLCITIISFVSVVSYIINIYFPDTSPHFLTGFGSTPEDIVFINILCLLISFTILVIFLYFFKIQITKKSGQLSKIVVFLSSVCVLTAIVWASLLSTSVIQKRKDILYDGQRSTHLYNIERQIIGYKVEHGVMPKNLVDLNGVKNGGFENGFIVPQDPQGGEYVYTVMGVNSYNICANFALTETRQEGGNIDTITSKPIEDYFSHGQGKVCFDRTISTPLDYKK